MAGLGHASPTATVRSTVSTPRTSVRYSRYVQRDSIRLVKYLYSCRSLLFVLVLILHAACPTLISPHGESGRILLSEAHHLLANCHYYKYSHPDGRYDSRSPVPKTSAGSYSSKKAVFCSLPCFLEKAH